MTRGPSARRAPILCAHRGRQRTSSVWGARIVIVLVLGRGRLRHVPPSRRVRDQLWVGDTLLWSDHLCVPLLVRSCVSTRLLDAHALPPAALSASPSHHHTCHVRHTLPSTPSQSAPTQPTVARIIASTTSSADASRRTSYTYPSIALTARPPTVRLPCPRGSPTALASLR